LTGWRAGTSFSFAHQLTTGLAGLGPLRVINDDTIAAGRGFGLHPHRDTGDHHAVMLEGELSHSDSMSNGEMLRGPARCNAMSAGKAAWFTARINLRRRACRAVLQILD